MYFDGDPSFPSVAPFTGILGVPENPYFGGTKGVAEHGRAGRVLIIFGGQEKVRPFQASLLCSLCQFLKHSLTSDGWEVFCMVVGTKFYILWQNIYPCKKDRTPNDLTVFGPTIRALFLCLL